jgi:RepB DNA-primase from phage plasmid
MVLYVYSIFDEGEFYASGEKLSRGKIMATKNTTEAVDLQTAAMHAEVYEIGLFDSAGRRQMLPRVWDRDTLLRSIAWLRAKNAAGRNIYIRPAGEHRLTLLDDIGWRTVARLKEEGFEPAVLVETSPGNFQAWLYHGRLLPRDLSTFAARFIARRFLGNPAYADWRNYGRLAGFTNRKKKYRRDTGLYPFVLLHEASGRIYRRASEFLAEIEKMFSESQSRERPRSPMPCIEYASSSLKTLDDFRQRPVYGGDHTRSDLAYAVYALAHGISESQVRQDISSRDRRHNRDPKHQQSYLDRTLQKALRRLGDAHRFTSESETAI